MLSLERGVSEALAVEKDAGVLPVDAAIAGVDAPGLPGKLNPAVGTVPVLLGPLDELAVLGVNGWALTGAVTSDGIAKPPLVDGGVMVGFDGIAKLEAVDGAVGALAPVGNLDDSDGIDGAPGAG